MIRVLTILLGRNQDFDAAEAIIAKHSGDRIEPVVILGENVIEANIDPAVWDVVREELEAAKYGLD